MKGLIPSKLVQNEPNLTKLVKTSPKWFEIFKLIQTCPIWFKLVPGFQPDGGERENCLTTFRIGSDSPKWYDRPCIENDSIDNPGHRFMCEATTEHHCKQSFSTGTNFDLPMKPFCENR